MAISIGRMAISIGRVVGRTARRVGWVGLAAGLTMGHLGVSCKAQKDVDHISTVRCLRLSDFEKELKNDPKLRERFAVEGGRTVVVTAQPIGYPDEPMACYSLDRKNTLIGSDFTPDL